MDIDIDTLLAQFSLIDFWELNKAFSSQRDLPNENFLLLMRLDLCEIFFG
jgi:hypothetical protein